MCIRDRLDLGQLGHAVHQQCHFLAKGCFQVVQRGEGILHYVMQQDVYKRQILRVRICTSKGMPSCPMTVVCLSLIHI